jgi:hypothetical protein
MAGKQSKQQCADQKQQELVILLFTVCLAACPRFVSTKETTKIVNDCVFMCVN